MHPRLRVLVTDYAPSVAALLEPACSVIHLAALRNVPRRRAEAFARTNAGLSATLARAAVVAGAGRFVDVSTALTLGPSEVPLDSGAPFDERFPGAYVRSRVDAALAVERMAADRLPLVTILPSIVYGPDHPRARNRIASHIRRVLARPLRIAIAGPQARRNLVYVDDVTDSILRAERSECPTGRHLVSGENVTQDDLEAEVRTVAGMRPSLRVAVPRAAARAAARTVDALLRFDPASGWTSRLETLLAPWCLLPAVTLGGTATPFSEGVRRTVEAVRRESARRRIR